MKRTAPPVILPADEIKQRQTALFKRIDDMLLHPANAQLKARAHAVVTKSEDWANETNEEIFDLLVVARLSGDETLLKEAKAIYVQICPPSPHDIGEPDGHGGLITGVAAVINHIDRTVAEFDANQAQSLPPSQTMTAPDGSPIIQRLIAERSVVPMDLSGPRRTGPDVILRDTTPRKR